MIVELRAKETTIVAMSVRKKEDLATVLRAQLKALKETQCQPIEAASEAAPDAALPSGDTEPKLTFDQLTPTEQAAASLGVDPNALKPISFMNNKHYESLIKANALDDNLARRIEAYRVVSKSSN